MTFARQNFSTAAEQALNVQINNELYASYQYLAMSAYFGNTNVALPGAAAYFLNQSLEEREHAQKLINYLNDRGGKVEFFNITVSFISCFLIHFSTEFLVSETHRRMGKFVASFSMRSFLGKEKQ